MFRFCMTFIMAKQLQGSMVKIRILLVNPHHTISETPSPHRGLAFLARYEFQVRISNFVVFPPESDILDNEIKTFRPVIVGTRVVTMNSKTAMKILEEAKRFDPDVVTLSAGLHLTNDAQRSLQKHKAMDIAVIGDGEQTLHEIVRCIEKKNVLPAVAGIAFRNSSRIMQTVDCRISVVDGHGVWLSPVGPVPGNRNQENLG